MKDYIHSKTLILNRAYYPINVINWKKAIELSLDSKNNVLKYYDEYISTVSTKFQLPAVIVITDYIGINTTLNYSKYRVFIRDGHICSYCGERFKKSELTIDHVIPKSKGGTTGWKNCVTSCNKCNSKKGDKTPSEAGMELKIVPFAPKYDYNYFLNWNGVVPKEWEELLPEKRKPKIIEVVPELKFGRRNKHV